MPPMLEPPLRLSKKRLQAMIRQHEIMLDVLRNPALFGTLQQLVKDEDARKKWAADGQLSARVAGFAFPETVDVALQQFRGRGGGWQVEVRVYEDPFTYVFGFDSVKGFYHK